MDINQEEEENTKKNGSSDSESETEIEGAEFYFESDHLALRGNPDYTLVLRTLTILEAQRVQATKDIDTLALAEKQALEDPEAFVAKLTSGESLNLPNVIQIVELPKINFEKYGISPDLDIEEGTRKKPESDDIRIRGRAFDQSKPETFNQLWTCEEQRRLEELLIEYPPEEVENRRFAKIAQALGNRTRQQVASRIQKYFKKLHSVGMTIPGRLTKSHRVIPRPKTLLKRLRDTTFFPDNNVPVKINEDDDDYYDELNNTTFDPHYYRQGRFLMSNSLTKQSSDYTTYDTVKVVDDGDDDDYDEDDNDAVADEDDDNSNTDIINVDTDRNENTNYSEKCKIMKLMKRIKHDKTLYSTSDKNQLSRHTEYKCDNCSEEPIIGTRWHCVTCTHSSIDFCSDCVITQLLTTKYHPLDHKLIGIRMVNCNSDSVTSTRQQSELDSDFYETDMNDINLNKEQLMVNSGSITAALNTIMEDEVPKKITKLDEFNYLNSN